MEASAEVTLSNLHVLAALSHNDKLMTASEIFSIYAPTTMRAVMRMWYGEQRAQNVLRVRQTVRAAVAYAAKSHEDAQSLMAVPAEDPAMRLRIDTIAVQHLRMVEGLRRARHGIAHLLQTYRDDAALASQVTLVMEEIDAFLGVMGVHSDALRARRGIEAPVRSPTLLAACAPDSAVASPLLPPPLHPSAPSSPRRDANDD